MSRSTPKVRDDLEYFEQVIDDDEVVLVRDPVRGQYFKYNVLQAAMLQALDGTRTPVEISMVLAEQYEVEIPPEAAERFIARLRDNLLLEIADYDTTPPAARRSVAKALRAAGFRRRSAERTEVPVSAQTRRFAAALRELDLGHPRAACRYLAEILAEHPDNARARQLYDLVQRAFIRSFGEAEIPTWVLFNPSRLLSWVSQKIGGVLFSWIGVLAIACWAVLGAHAATRVSFSNPLGPFDVALGIATLLTAAFFHELGHGLACQHYGGNVTEVGFMLFFGIQPAAFCDTSSSYTIANRRHRVIIQFAGLVASLVFVSGLAMLLAVLSPTVPVYPALALALLLITSFAFLNVIPFIKYDGYYALCDYVAFPNLRDRSFAIARAWLARRLLGLELPIEPLAPRTRRILIAYAIASWLFTAGFVYLVYFRLLAPFVEHFRGGGLVFAIGVTLFMMRRRVFRPLGRFFVLVVRERRRIFTLRRTVVLVAVAAAVIAPWFVRWPVLVDGEFVLVPVDRAELRAQVPGRIAELRVREGDHVRRGQTVAVLDNPALRARIAVAEAELARATQRLAMLRAGARPEELAVARRRLEHADAELRLESTAVTRARRLAKAELATASSVDVAARRRAGAAAVAGRARWSLALLEAGSRDEAIAAAAAERAARAHELDHLRNDRGRLTIRSPIDGVVVTPHLEEHLQQQLAPGDLVAEIQDVREVVAEIAIPPSEPLGDIDVGDDIELRADGAPDRPIRARVARLREAAEDAHGVRRVIAVTTPLADAPSISGLSGHARIYGDEHTLAYAHLYLPLERLVRIRLWSMW